ncbi:MAG: proprotein convertase P-domain-containing protein [Lutibacter sp.]|nr:proprotein convertase P-domain-containing protein [Lutibacter sp.]
MRKYYKKQFLLTLSLCLVFFAVSAQNSDELWSKRTGFEKSTAKKLSRKSIPNKFESYELNLNQLKSKLSNAPKRKENIEKSSTVLSFPNEKGVLEKYQIFEASVMDENLQKKYPNIRSYVGKGIDNPGSVIRFSVTPQGLHAMVMRNVEGNIYIDPTTENGDSYMVYSSKNLPSASPFECKFDEVNTTQKTSATTTAAKAENANDGKLRTFRLAVATTGEYSQFHLNRQNISPSATDAVKKAAVLSAIVTTMTRVNGIYERDVSLTMQLVANNTAIIFLDADTDGLSNDNPDNILLDESQTVIDANIGNANYDIGHTFSTGGGGVAQLNSPCNTGRKAKGITGLNRPVGDPFDIDFVSHEMGHQYGAHHTFNGETGGCGGNKNSGTAVEPGSGSTIMSYAGICSPYNVQNDADAYFHLVSIREMWSNITTGSSTCAVLSNTGNTAPVINDLLNYTIPKSTPFILTANATDSNGDHLTYTWEQLDTEITSYPLVSTATGGPAFRSILPSNSSSRYFPNQTTVNAGNLSNTWEVLPSVSRTMKFGVNVRDNRVGGGQTASKETVITFAGGAGPFKVTSQSAAVTWSAGTSQTITWDVANTNSAPVNCSFVNIRLSLDGGLTFPLLLASNTSNDGLHEIVVPNKATTKARIKVESAGNIFYSVNTKNITVQTSEFIMNFDEFSQNVCVPNSATFNFTYNTFLDFNEVTTFTAAGHPVGSTITFNPATATANNTNVRVTISGISVVGNYDISIKGTAASANKTTNINLGAYSETVAAPTLVSPINNAIDVLKPFILDWNDDINATNYTVQIAENSNFGPILESENVNVSAYSPQNLQPKTTYFWRVKSINDCGESVFSNIFNFTTENDVCDTNVAIDIPKNIPDNNATGVSSTIAISTNKIIRDVKVTVNITHEWVGDLDLTLISPSGRQVLLSANNGDEGTGYINTVFDDGALNSISAGIAPFTGSFRPEGSLSNFYDEESLGIWTLKAVDSGPVDIGTINGWSLEICGVPKINPNDLDNDGVMNDVDQCPNTTPGSLVDAAGCFTLPANNFTIEVISETCPDKNNGQIKITAVSALNYTTTINGASYNFTNATPVSTPANLPPGTYNFCVGVIGQTYQQCFTIQIAAGTTVSAKSSVTSGKVSVEIEEGTAPFTVYVNGLEQFETSAPLFSVDVKNGDLLEVKTAKSCEGVFSKNIEIFNEVIAYPNPTQGLFEIAIPTAQTEVVIELYTINSQLISTKKYPVVYGKVQLSLENKPTGLYFAKVNLDQPVTLKIIKQ